jgi:hypothetical protein
MTKMTTFEEYYNKTTSQLLKLSFSAFLLLGATMLIGPRAQELGYFDRDMQKIVKDILTFESCDLLPAKLDQKDTYYLKCEYVKKPTSLEQQIEARDLYSDLGGEVAHMLPKHREELKVQLDKINAQRLKSEETVSVATTRPKVKI